MKNLFTLLLVLTGIASFAQLNISQPNPATVCETNSDGFAAFNLAASNTQVLGILSPLLYSVAYYSSMADLQAGTGALPLMYTNTVAWHQVLYVKVYENANPANSGTTTLDLYVGLMPTVPAVTLTLCEESLPNDGRATFNLTSANAQLTANCATCTVAFFENGSPIANPEAYQNTANPQTVDVEVSASAGGPVYCTVYSTIILKVNPLPSITSLDPLFYCDGLFDLTANVQINPYDYSFYTSYDAAVAGTNAWNVSQPYQGTHVFVKLSVPNTNADEPVCYTIIEQQLLSGADFEVNLNIAGQEATVNVTGSGHYRFVMDSNPPQTSNVFENLAPGIHTVYVTDLVCGNEIARQFEILPDAGTAANTFSGLEFYPNPVADVLTLKNEGTAITVLEVYNTLGQKVQQQHYNSTQVQANLSALRAGIYMVKVHAGAAVKTLKIVKD